MVPSPADAHKSVALSNDFGILLPDHDADPERELQGECSGPSSLPGQQQFLVRWNATYGNVSRGSGSTRGIWLANSKASAKSG